MTLETITISIWTPKDLFPYWKLLNRRLKNTKKNKKKWEVTKTIEELDETVLGQCERYQFK